MSWRIVAWVPLAGRQARDRNLVRQLLEEPLTERLSGVVRVLFAPHRSADDTSGRRWHRGHGSGRCRVLAEPRDVPSVAPRRSVFGRGRDGHVPDLFRRDERRVRAWRSLRLGSAIPARSVGNLALDSYGNRDRRVHRGIARASALMTLNTRVWLGTRCRRRCAVCSALWCGRDDAVLADVDLRLDLVRGVPF